MKRFLTALALIALAAPAFAGLAYKFESRSTGASQSTIGGEVEVDGPKLRMNITSGDGVMFQNDSIVITTDGGKTMAVINPDNTYYKLDLDSVLGGAGATFKAMGDMVKITFQNQKVNVKDEGDGGKIEGYPTMRSSLDASYDMNVAAMGQMVVSHVVMKTESWVTDKISSDSMNFFQMRGVKTGIDGLDSLIDAQAKVVRRGFPLKQIITINVEQNGQKMTQTTTSSVSNIQQRNVVAADFTIPNGLTKVDSPMEKLMQQVKAMTRK